MFYDPFSGFNFLFSVYKYSIVIISLHDGYFFGKMWESLKSLVNFSNCMLKKGLTDLKINHAPSTLIMCHPRDVDIIGEDYCSMNRFVENLFNNLEVNAEFYPSMRQTTPPIIPPFEMFSYLHPERRNEPKFPSIGQPSSSTQVNIQPSYAKKVTKFDINLEEKYGKGFTILREQRCDMIDEHEINQLLEQPQIKTTRGLGYRHPPSKPKVPMEYLNLIEYGRIIFPPNINILLP